MTTAHPPMELTKLPTGIIGFDQIANGGIPKGRSTLMSGTAGSGKTVMALQFLLAGVRDYGENGVFVTFEEAPADLMQNVRSFGWDLEGLLNQKQIAVVDATPEPGEDTLAVGPYDPSALLARIEHSLKRRSVDEASRSHLRDSADSLRQALDAKLPRFGI